MIETSRLRLQSSHEPLSYSHVSVCLLAPSATAPLEVTVRPSNQERYTLEPPTLTLAPHATGAIEVRLKLLAPLPPRRPGGAGGPRAGALKDAFTVKTKFGVQRFFAVLLPPGEATPQQRASVPFANTSGANTSGANTSGANTSGVGAAAEAAAAVTAASFFDASDYSAAMHEHAMHERAALEQTVNAQAEVLIDQRALLQLAAQRRAQEVAEAHAAAVDLAQAAAVARAAEAHAAEMQAKSHVAAAVPPDNVLGGRGELGRSFGSGALLPPFPRSASSIPILSCCACNCCII